MTVADIFASARGPMQPRPFPIAPLVAAAHVALPWKLGELVGAGGSVIANAAANGLTWQQADTWACRLGKHPSEVFGELWWSTCPLDDEDDMEGEAA